MQRTDTFQKDPEEKHRKSGWPKNQDQEQAFMKVWSYLESNGQLTITHPREKMSPQPNTTAKGFTSRSWCGLERKVTWTQWIGDRNWWTASYCQLWLVILLPQKASCRWSTVIAQLTAEQNGAVAGHMDYHACLIVEEEKWLVMNHRSHQH